MEGSVKLSPRIAFCYLLPFIAWSTSVHAGEEVVTKNSQKGIASHSCFGVYCAATICPEIRNTSDNQPGTAQFFYEGGIFGDLEDVGTHTGKHCIHDWGIGVLLMRIEIKAISDDLIVKVSDQFDK
jgi:hypothetical protein